MVCKRNHLYFHYVEIPKIKKKKKEIVTDLSNTHAMKGQRILAFGFRFDESFILVSFDVRVLNMDTHR